MKWVLSAVLIGVLAASAGAATITYDVTTDFSDVNNPNGVWSFKQGTTPFPRHAANTPVTNSFDPAAANGYWGSNADYNSSVTKTAVKGSSSTNGSTTFTDNDFLAGDVVAHSTTPGNGGVVTLSWTAPSAGTITYNGSVWYAHSFVARSNDYAVLLNGVATGFTGTVSQGVTRSAPSTFSQSTLVPVSAGDVLSLQLTPHAGQTFGSLAGVTFHVTLTPEPSAVGVLACAMLALTRRRRSPPATHPATP